MRRRFAPVAAAIAGTALTLALAVALGGCYSNAARQTSLDSAARDRIESFLASGSPAVATPGAESSATLNLVLFEPAGMRPATGADAQAGDGLAVYAYGDVLETSWTLRTANDGAVTGVTEGSGSAYPVRVLLREERGALRPLRVDAPRDGSYAEDVRRLFPGDIRKRLDGDGRRRLFDREADEVRAWVDPLLATDWLVRLDPPPDLADPHEHAEGVYEQMCLTPGLEGVSIAPTNARPREASQWELAAASPNGAYRAYYDLSGTCGLVLERVKDSRCFCVSGAGGVAASRGGATPGAATAQLYRATFKDDRTLVVDRVDVASDPVRSVTHIEIDVATLRVLRAVPLGPLGSGRAIPVH